MRRHRAPFSALDTFFAVRSWGAVPVTSSQALNNATLPFGLTLANRGFAACHREILICERDSTFIAVASLTKTVAESLGLSFSPVDDCLAA